MRDPKGWIISPSRLPMSHFFFLIKEVELREGRGGLSWEVLYLAFSSAITRRGNFPCRVSLCLTTFPSSFICWSSSSQIFPSKRERVIIAPVIGARACAFNKGEEFPNAEVAAKIEGEIEDLEVIKGSKIKIDGVSAQVL